MPAEATNHPQKPFPSQEVHRTPYFFDQTVAFSFAICQPKKQYAMLCQLPLSFLPTPRITAKTNRNPHVTLTKLSHSYPFCTRTNVFPDCRIVFVQIVVDCGCKNK